MRTSELAQLYGMHRSKNQAISGLRALASSHALCLHALGLSSGKDACEGYRVGQCKGVCCGEEKPELHWLRVQLALAPQCFATWPHHGPIGVREHDHDSQRSDVHLFDQWCYLGTARDDAELHERLACPPTPPVFDLDVYRLLLKWLAPGGKSSPIVITF